MKQLLIEYLSPREFIIDKRYWIYSDGNLYIYDNECKTSENVKEWEDYRHTHSITSICPEKFDEYENYLSLIRNRHPLSVVKKYVAREFRKEEKYSYLICILWEYLHTTSYVFVVDGYYDFSFVQYKSETDYYMITHHSKYDKKNFEYNEKTKMVKKYIEDHNLKVVNSEFKFLGKEMHGFVNMGYRDYK